MRHAIGRSLVSVMLASHGDAGFSDSTDTQDKTPESSVTDAFAGPTAVTNQLDEDHQSRDASIQHHLLEDWREWKQELSDDAGFGFSVDYNAITQKASNSLGEDSATSGVVRLYGKWNLNGHSGADTGGLVFKVESRDAYSDVPPNVLGSELGYIGSTAIGYSNQHFRTTNLYWRHNLDQAGFVTYAGFVDVTDYTDVYMFASPWTAFTNSVFLNGSGTMGGLPDGALGAVAAKWLSDTVYVIAGVADANADPTDVFQGFDTFFSDFETFKNLDIHWTPQKDQIYLNNLHVSVWQLDERTTAGTNDGWGISFSLNADIDDRYFPFVRGGWAEDGSSDLEASLSIGVGYQQTQSNLMGIAFNWGRPNEDTFGPGLDDQYTSEMFFRWQLAKAVQVTPSIQLLANPALNPEEDFISIIGLRVRLLI